MQTRLWLPAIFFVTLGNPGAATADAHANEIRSPTDQLAALRDEVEQMQKAIELLQAIQPTITSLMPEFAERFHVMHYAGEAEDWAVASHELFELRRLIGIMKKINPEKGAMVSGFLIENFKQLDMAIEHQDMEEFKNLLARTVKNCNACHVAAGSPFMRVVLDARDSLSMRHSLDLSKSTKPGMHTHTH